MMRFKLRQRGVALILSLAILAVLAVLAITFTRLMIVEHAASKNYVAATRARALATAGVEYALGRLRLRARNTHASHFTHNWMYKLRLYDGTAIKGKPGFTWTSGAGLPIEGAFFPAGARDSGDYPFSKGVQVYGELSWYKGNPGVGAGLDPLIPEIYNAKIEKSKRGAPISGWIGARTKVKLASGKFGYEGPRARFPAGTEEAWGDTFALKVLDCASQININMIDGGPSGSKFPSPMLRSFLNDLGEEIDNFFRFKFMPKGNVRKWNTYEMAQFGYNYVGFYTFFSGKKSKLGDWLIGERNKKPGDVFQSKEDVLNLFNELYPSTSTFSVGGKSRPGNQVALEEYNKLKDFITLYGFRDRTVIEPGTLMTAEQWGAKDKKWKWRGARSPINMNTVSNPVLVAWMRGISYGKWVNGAYKSKPVEFRKKFSVSKLRTLAYLFRQVVKHSPLLAWKGLDALMHAKTPTSGGDVPTQVDPLTGKPVGGKGATPIFQKELAKMMDKWDRDAFLAMADPNAMLNKYNPDAIVRREVDKYDLTSWTTEMSFNSMGYYEITSLGTITENGGHVRAQKKIRAVFQIFDQVIRTTQRDFELNRELTGVDVKTGKSIRLWDEKFWGVLSYPEFRNKFRDYEESIDLTSKAPATYGYVALYDGVLSFNALTRTTSFDGDFLAGFNYPFGTHPATKSKTAVDGFKPKDTSSNARKGGLFARSYPKPGGGRYMLTDPTIDNSAKKDKALAFTRFNGGSDAFPMGIYMDTLRKRYLAYRGTTAVTKGTVGSLELWVKPRFDRSIGLETYFYWQDSSTPTEQYIWIYRDGINVTVDFSIGNSPGGRLLKYDASAWKAGSWHHIHMDWGDTGRLFVDGEMADQGGSMDDGKKDHPRARHMDFGGWPPKTQKKMDVWTANPTKYSRQISWVNKHIPKKPGKYKISGTADVTVGWHKAGTFANATIDNITLTTWRIFKPDTMTFNADKLQRRYFSKEYRGYSRMYWQDITDAFKDYKSDIKLGTIAWTNWHTNQGFIKGFVKVGGDAAEEAPGGQDGLPLKDILTSSNGTLPYTSGSFKTLLWGAEFVSTDFSGGKMVGTQESAFLHDFTMTYLLPSPQQLERREIDF